MTEMQKKRSHHKLRHVLSDEQHAAAVAFFGGTGAEAGKRILELRQREMQETFAEIYGVETSSCNNEWLRGKLLRAVGLPPRWRPSAQPAPSPDANSDDPATVSRYGRRRRQVLRASLAFDSSDEEDEGVRPPGARPRLAAAAQASYSTAVTLSGSQTGGSIPANSATPATSQLSPHGAGWAHPAAADPTACSQPRPPSPQLFHRHHQQLQQLQQQYHQQPPPQQQAAAPARAAQAQPIASSSAAILALQAKAAAAFAAELVQEPPRSSTPPTCHATHVPPPVRSVALLPPAATQAQHRPAAAQRTPLEALLSDAALPPPLLADQQELEPLILDELSLGLGLSLTISAQLVSLYAAWEEGRVSLSLGPL